MSANATDDVGQTLLNWASAYGSVAMIIALCDAGKSQLAIFSHIPGADVNAGSILTPLHCAVLYQNTAIIYELLRRGASPTKPDQFGTTAVQLAESKKLDAIVQVCLSV